ncbi:MAG: hypothetical protein PHY42_06335 [Bacilli bacterium]|nr:hypothetical protein [Bacilli bacterium]
MSDIRVWSIKNKKEFRRQEFHIQDLQEVIASSSEALLGLRMIARQYLPRLNATQPIAAIALDEVNQLVLLEYRKGKYGQLIQKGLMQLDYVKEHLSEFKMLVADAGFDPKTIYWVPRLLILGDDFNEFDAYAIRQLPYPIELIKVASLVGEVFVFEKNFISNHLQDHDCLPPQETTTVALLRDLLQFVTSLGDEVVGLGRGNEYHFRKMKYFLTIEWNDGLKVHFIHKQKWMEKTIKTTIDLEKVYPLIEEAYDEG